MATVGPGPTGLVSNQRCRTCMCFKSNQTPLFRRNLSLKVMKLADIKLREDDGLPTTICLDCEIDLERCYGFIAQIQNSDKKLRESLQIPHEIKGQEEPLIEEQQRHCNELVSDPLAPETINQYEIKQECIHIESVMDQESYNSNDNHSERYFESHVEVVEDRLRVENNELAGGCDGQEEPLIEDQQRHCNEPVLDPLNNVKVEAETMNDEPTHIPESPMPGPSTQSPANTRKEKVGEVRIKNFQDNKRKKKRRNCCPFCIPVKSVTNFARHLIKHHKQEDEVKEYLSIMDNDLKIRRIKRWTLSDNIRKKGNHLYNLKVINKEIDDELLPVKTPSNKEYQVTNLTHVVCSYCLGLFKKQNMYLHVKNCKKNKKNNKPSTRSEDLSESRSRRVLNTCSHMLVPNLTLTNEESQMRENIFQSMVKDEISLTAQSDPLIVAFGARLFSYHREDHHRTYISSKMRDVAKVLLAVKDLTSEINTFEDCLDPNNFSVLMDVRGTWENLMMIPAIWAFQAMLLVCVPLSKHVQKY